MGIMKILSAFLLFASVCSGARMTQPMIQMTTTQTPLPATMVSTASYAVLDEMATFTSATFCPDATNNSIPLGRLRMTLRNSAYLRKDTLLDAYIVFFSDEHLSEEPSADERRLEYISGWDGVGTAVVLADGGAAIWVPSGELYNAKTTLSCAWEIMDADDPAHRTVPEWIVDRLGRKGRIGGDARLTSITEWSTISQSLHREGLLLIDVPNLVDQLWNDELDSSRRRPEFSKIVANEHQMEYVGQVWQEKVAAVRNELKAVGAEAMVVTALDEVAWLLNVRGRDVPYAPLLKAFVIVSLRDVRVFAPPGKLSMPIRKVLGVYTCNSNNYNCTRISDYSAIYDELRRSTESKILIPASGTFQRGASAAITQSIPMTKRMPQLSPIIYLKAQKNEAEAKGMRKAHLRDAVAMCTLFYYLENQSGLSEMSVQMTVDNTRETQARYVGPAMQTRVAFGPSAAEPEYRPTNGTNRKIYKNSTLVVRSGGQYDEGTTVVTRTVHYGTPSRDERRAYTSVLRGVSALATLVTPSTLAAAHVDPALRAPLWAADQDYPHPTGHGVGAALNRKEDPVVIDYRQDTNLHTLREGYFITCEPGWYESGKFGIRLGNILEVIGKPNDYIGFREVTLLPFEPKLIDKNMLTEYEIIWLNGYNDRIRKIVGPELMSRGLTGPYYWMMNKTVPIELPLKTKKAQLNSALSVGGFWELTAFISFLILLMFS